MSEYTKGPWKVYKMGRKSIIQATDQFNTWVCEVVSGIPSKEEESNAHLIAAAPDIHKALKKLIKLTENITDKGAAYTGRGKWQSPELQTARLEAEQAILKAEGKE